MSQLLILIQVEDILLIVGTLSEKAWRNHTFVSSLLQCRTIVIYCCVFY